MGEAQMVASVQKEPMTLTFLGEPCRVVDETLMRPTEYEPGSFEVTLAVSSMETIEHHLKGEAMGVVTPFHYGNRVWPMTIVGVLPGSDEWHIHLKSTGPPSLG